MRPDSDESPSSPSTARRVGAGLALALVLALGSGERRPPAAAASLLLLLLWVGARMSPVPAATGGLRTTLTNASIIDQPHNQRAYAQCARTHTHPAAAAAS
ncbi:hypothetical protein EON68_04230 [archaeon]|nr:MAG: hypothetical protein EON68_04230 [archaeon]